VELEATLGGEGPQEIV